MTEAKVYYSDMRAHGRSLLSKLRRLMKEAGFESIDFDGKFVAVKIHFGEPGNLAYLRPNLPSKSMLSKPASFMRRRSLESRLRPCARISE